MLHARMPDISYLCVMLGSRTFRGNYIPPTIFIFMAQNPPIFIGMPCTNTMFTSLVLLVVQLAPQGMRINAPVEAGLPTK